VAWGARHGQLNHWESDLSHVQLVTTPSFDLKSILLASVSSVSLTGCWSRDSCQTLFCPESLLCENVVKVFMMLSYR